MPNCDQIEAGQETIESLAGRIKAKYPDYKAVGDAELVSRITNKYPEYKGRLRAGEFERMQPGAFQIKPGGLTYNAAQLQGPTEFEKNTQPGFFARTSERLGLTQDPIGAAKSDCELLKKDHIGKHGQATKNLAQMPYNLGKTLLTDPRALWGGREFAEDVET